MNISNAEGTFMIDSDSNTKICNISLKIPQQVIYLRSYRIEFDSQAHALANPIIYLDAPFLSSNQLIDTNPTYVYFPLFVDNSVVTFTYGKDVPLYLSNDIPIIFPIRFLDINFVPVSNLVRVSIQFSLTKGSLG